ncbi:CorA family magnesium transporter [Aspergillus stella-maris]|uniref:CorA family magnesium transporter n=1 Tax=Aspergillus stella-maris TaxID=1810926 RepID=UPI003CCE0196
MFLCRSQRKGLDVGQLLLCPTSYMPFIASSGIGRVSTTRANISSVHSGDLITSRNVHTRTRTEIDFEPENRKKVLDLAVSFSQRPLDGNTTMQYTTYQRQDPSPSTAAYSAAGIGQMTKREVEESYGLSTRDLRVFDQESAGLPHILVRESAILLHLFDIRLLVQHDHARMFKLTHGASIEAEAESSNDNDEGCASRVFRHNMEDRVQTDQKEQTMPELQHYELYVLEAALSSVTSVLEAEYILTEEKVSRALQATDYSTLNGDERTMHSNLRRILELKRRLTSIEQRALQMRDMAHESLNEDEDMANMYLTDKFNGKPHDIGDHQSVEYLFEAYFKASDTIAQQAASLVSRIRRTEETIQYTLSVRRNQIMVLEARLEILMLAFAGATLVAGWYGMNLVNGDEESPHAFAIVILASCVAALAASAFGMYRLRRIRTAQLRT